MNTDTNELYRILGENFGGDFAKGLTPLPLELNHAAETVLKGNDKARVSFNSGGKLSKWAAKQRKAKRRMQKQSRNKNR